MYTRIARAFDVLRYNGWIIHISDEKLDWWIDEAFERYSIWNLTGAKIHLTVDVDPDTTSNRRKGDGIVSISLSKTISESRLSTEQFIFLFSASGKYSFISSIKV